MSESEVQTLRTEFKDLEKLAADRFEQTEKHREDPVQADARSVGRSEISF